MTTDAPERIAMRWDVGAAVTSGPLMTHPDYTRYVREDATFTVDDLRRAWEMGHNQTLREIWDHDNWKAACGLTPPDDLPARVKEGGDE